MTDPRFDSDLATAIELGDDGALTAALAAFDRLVANYPNEMPARFERAMVLLNLDRDAEAIADLEHVLEHDPDYPGARNWYAIAQRDQGNPMLAAETKLTELLAHAPGDWSVSGQAWADCARYFLDAGAPERALAALAIYFARYEGRQSGWEDYRPAPYRLQALTLLALNRPREALAAAERACQDPHRVPADTFVRIRALAAVGEIDRAVGELEQLRAEFQTTQPFQDAVADLRRLGLAIA